ncbi:HPr serine kinase-like protein [Actibacterium atlanticum]|uniref:HPr serine kinase-like protein n=1 Tax=Actibacterium atlanticum TaxID=1461693 RepID=A0A058ZLT1_9RHOB|nr:HPr kinase/phosphatase C-terminal domain-containing protein [Actibacterium atlanticum]KCV82165.1 HPr serine kinase-like protein [Actibacterium atlanticum]
MIHATCLALNGQGILLTGPSGSGKSALGLQLMAFGAHLIADDQTVLDLRGDQVFASAPPQIRGMIEARGVGILAAQAAPATPVRLVIDMAQQEIDRLPQDRHTILLGQKITLLHKVTYDHFPAAILQYIKGGRCA